MSFISINYTGLFWNHLTKNTLWRMHYFTRSFGLSLIFVCDQQSRGSSAPIQARLESIGGPFKKPNLISEILSEWVNTSVTAIGWWIITAHIKRGEDNLYIRAPIKIIKKFIINLGRTHLVASLQQCQCKCNFSRGGDPGRLNGDPVRPKKKQKKESLWACSHPKSKPTYIQYLQHGSVATALPLHLQ